MLRKVIKLANNTFVVSLPAKWVKKVSLSKGDEVDVDDAGDVLLVSRSGSAVSRSFVLDVSKMSFDKNIISYLYQKGYDEVEIVNLNADIFEEVKSRVGDLMGFEIIERSEKRCIVKAVSKEIESEFDNILRRTFFIILEMSRNLAEVIPAGNVSRISEIRELEKTTNTFTDFCKRVLSKGRYGNPENTMYMYVLVRDLEKVADGYKRICDVILEQKARPVLSKKVLDVLVRTNSFFESFYRLFYRFDPAGFQKFKEEGKSLQSAANGIMKGCTHLESLVLSHVLFVINETYEMMGPYFILNFDFRSR
ncbi:phosphate uptake regulator PhoU [Candidatus Woesearchaeota archaeon]|nr:phosphate uptake regulator PhoU [Candidatus Woesearchaeota archaeon]